MSRKTIKSLTDFDFNEYRNSSQRHNGESIINVTNCNIDFEIIFTQDSFSTIEFNNCIFLKKITIKNIETKKCFDFINCEFKDEVYFENIIVKSKSRFWGTKFNQNTSFLNVSFKDLADFFQANFSKKIIFYKVDFFATTVFTETEFNENVLFTYTKIADVIIFTRTKFNAGMDLSLAIITGKINIHSSDLDKFPDVADTYNNEEYRDYAENQAIITRNNKRETFRILKKHSKDDLNQFKYLEYSKLENEVYFQQLKSVKWKRFNNYIIFLANKYSNDHNMNWLLGVFFTAFSGFIFFYLAVISTELIQMSWNINSEVFVHYLGLYFNFLSPLHTVDLFINENPNTGTIVLDFFGRIFVSFGIYQTIQAFRKHKG